MRGRLTRESLLALMRELARSARSKRQYRIYLVGGGTAVLEGWRESSIDVDLYAKQDDIFRESKIVRGFARDLADARAFVTSGMVDPDRFRNLVQGISESVYSKYPRLSSAAVRAAVDDFLSSLT